MKRVGYLYEEIIALGNLELADKRAQKGKGWQRGIIKHNGSKHQEILELHRLLVNREYKTAPYFHFTKWDKKRREIFSLPYRDRIVQHAILQVISSIFIRCFIKETYSCIPKRGIHNCLDDLTKALKNREDTRYCLKIDIKKFYPSVDRNILKDLLRKKFKDRDLIYLLDGIIDSHPQGIPIGSYLSQFFGNFYLTYFDHWLKEKKEVKYYFRYTDDICILHDSKKLLYQLRRDIQDYLSITLGLELSNYQVFPVESRGIDFVGYKTFHTHTLLRKSIKNNYKKMMKYNRNEKSEASYNGWMVHANCINLKRKTEANRSLCTI